MQTPSTVLELVERFDTHRDHYTSTNCDEAQVRREFSDPLFSQITIRDVFTLALGTVRPSLPHEVGRNAKILSQVCRRVALHKRTHAAKTEHNGKCFSVKSLWRMTKSTAWSTSSTA